MSKVAFVVSITFVVVSLILVRILWSGAVFKKDLPRVPLEEKSAVLSISPAASLDESKWVRSFRAHDGTLYFRGHLKSSDGGKTVVSDTRVNFEDINAEAERAVISSKGLFYAVGGPARLLKPGVYSVAAWRSTDEMKTVSKEEAVVYVPQGPKRAPAKGEWYGLYVYRTIVGLPDGSWLMTMYGNFEADNLVSPDSDAQKETTFMMRTFVVQSKDKGRSWHYLSTVAVHRPGDPVGEGSWNQPSRCLMMEGFYAS